MAKVSDFRSFYKKWVEEFKAQKNAPPVPDNFWEGEIAFKELTKPIDWLIILVPDTDSADHPFTSLFELLWREIETYRRLAGRVVLRNQDYDKVAQVLRDAEQQVKAVESRLNVTGLAKVMWPVHREITKVLDQVEKLRQSSWQDVIKEYKIVDRAGERWVAPDSSDSLLPSPPIDVELREKLFKSLPTLRPMVQDRELDSLFQYRLAWIFKHYLPGVSLRTITRLIVLAYICADLALIDEVLIARGHLRKQGKTRSALVIAGTRTELTPEAVYIKLRKRAFPPTTFASP